MRYRSWALTRHHGGDECSDLFHRFDKVRIGTVGVDWRGLDLGAALRLARAHGQHWLCSVERLRLLTLSKPSVESISTGSGTNERRRYVEQDDDGGVSPVLARSGAAEPRGAILHLRAPPASFRVPGSAAIPSQTRGFFQCNPRNRAISASVEWSSAWCSIARAARCASVVRLPADPASSRSLNRMST